MSTTYSECDICPGAHETLPGETLTDTILREHKGERFCVNCEQVVSTMPDGVGCQACWMPTMSVEEYVAVTFE